MKVGEWTTTIPFAEDRMDMQPGIDEADIHNDVGQAMAVPTRQFRMRVRSYTQCVEII